MLSPPIDPVGPQVRITPRGERGVIEADATAHRGTEATHSATEDPDSMADNFQIVFVRAGDGSPAAQQSVAERIATASKTPIAKLLAQIESGPFVYKRGLPRAKADAIAATLGKLGAVTEVNEEGTPVAAAEKPGGGDGFDFGGSPAKEAGGFNFGGPASSDNPPAIGVGGFSFGAPPTPPTGNAFGFGGSGEFSIEDPGAPPPAPGGSGFDFSIAAAKSSQSNAPAMAATPVGVENNLDYAAASGDHKTKEPPPVHKTKAGAGTITCPRCEQQVAEAPECSNCGVVFAKAGDPGASGAGRRTRPRGKAKETKSNKPILVAAGIVVVLLLGGFVGGVFKPLQVRLAAGGNAMLKSYGVKPGAPVGGFSTAVVTNAERGQDLLVGFIGRSDRIAAELARLQSLSSIAEFERGASALAPEVEAFRSHPAFPLKAEVQKVLAPFYQVQAVGLAFEGKTYADRDEAAIAEKAGITGITPILSDVEIRRLLDAAKQQVTAQEQQRLGSERREAVNVDYADNFDSDTLNERWQVSADAGAQFSQGWLYLTARPGNRPAQGPHLLLAEPEADYVLSVTVSGTPKDSSRAGLVIMENDQLWVSLVRAGRRQSNAVQVVTNGGPGPDAQCDATVTIQIERKGAEYSLSYWNQKRLVSVDRIRPFSERAPRRIGLAAFGGTTGFFFDDFRLTISR